MKVKIVGVDSQTGKLTLSLKQLLRIHGNTCLTCLKDTQVKVRCLSITVWNFVTCHRGSRLIHMVKFHLANQKLGTN